MTRSCVLLTLVAFSEGGAPGELLLLQQISRHGARAPKTKYFGYCPSDPYNYKWDSWNEQLTGPGGLEASAIGEVTRQRYGHWLGAYNGSHMTVRSVDSDRVLQTAEIAMASLYPAGTGPGQGLSGRPTFVPVHTTPEEEDDLLKCPAFSCEHRQKADYESWWSAQGAEILREGKAALPALTAFCGVEATSNKILKEQVDGIGFDFSQGFITKKDKLTTHQLWAAQNLSIHLQRGDFASDEARTYMAGDLPEALVSNMDQAIAQHGSDQAQRYVNYFAHRHAGYALAEFFGWRWQHHGLPEGMMQTATTIWIELRHGAEAGQFDVAFHQWWPHCPGHHDDDDEGHTMSDCPAKAIALPGCTREGGTLCSIEEFRAMVTQRIARTGSWRSLCGIEVAI